MNEPSNDGEQHAVLVGLSTKQVDAVAVRIRDCLIACRDDLGMSDVEVVSSLMIATGILAGRVGIDLCSDGSMQVSAGLLHLAQHLPPASLPALMQAFSAGNPGEL